MGDDGVRRSRDLAWVESDARVVLLRVAEHDSTPLVLEGSAAAIWRALGVAATVSEVVAVVARQFGAAPADLRVDVESFLEEAAAAGLVERPAR